MDLQSINSAIINSKFTSDELDSIAMALRYARNQLTHYTIRSLRLNDKVSFVNKYRQTIVGKVSKIAQKYVTVTTPTVVYKVPASMLTLVD